MKFQRSLLRHVAAAAFLSVPAAAQQTIDALSFGHNGAVAPGPGQPISGWGISGVDYSPEVFSDRVILTPPAPGNRRGAAVANEPLNALVWKASLDFRASGQERGSGNLNLWLTKRPVETIPSVYTVEQFDGLVITVDQYAGTGGAVRGFLNDGSVNFKAHHNMNEMAFAQCLYPYRNLGRFTTMELEQRNDGFEVKVNGNTCFKTEKVRIPAGYTFGVTASSAENPDSFEVAKFVVSTSGSASQQGGQATIRDSFQNVRQDQQYQQQQQQQQYQGSQNQARDTHAPSHGLSDEHAATLELLVRTINQIRTELHDLDHHLHDRHEELQRSIGSRGGSGSDGGSASPGQLNNIELRIQSIENVVKKIQQDVEGRDYKTKLEELSRSVRETQTNLLNSLPKSMSEIVSTSGPSVWAFVSIIAAVQIMLVGAYVVYKRRRANAPKKFL